MAAQTESTPTPTYEKIKEWLAFASIIVVVAGGLLAGVLGVMKLAIAPLETDVRAIHDRLDRMDSHFHGTDSHIRGMDSRLGGLESRIRGLEHTMQNGFKAVRQDLSAFSERLIRVETLLEQVISQRDVPQ